MNILLCSTLLAFSHALKCHVSGEDGKVTSQQCFSGHITCSGPVFVEYTGIKNPNVVYKCGECEKTDEYNGDCTSCAKDDCNAIITTESFKCDNYEYDPTVKTYAKIAEKVTCYRLNGTEANCKMPGDITTDSFTSVCGVCSKANAEEGTCKEVENELDDSALDEDEDADSSSFVAVLSAFLVLFSTCNTL